MRMVLLVLVPLWIAVNSHGQEPKKDDGVPAELKKLEGVWLADHSLSQGDTIRRSSGINRKLIFGDKTFTMESFGQRGKQGTLTIDPTKKPKTLDISIPDKDGKPQTRLGIYELDGDTLSISWGEWGGKDRPAKFDREKQDIDVYKRDK